MKPTLAVLMSLALISEALVGCASSQGCNIPEEWQPLINRQPSPHALVVVRISLGPSNQIRWNGVSLDKQTLFRYLRISITETPRAFIDVRMNSVDCGDNRQVLEEIYRIYACADGGCGLQLELR